MNPDIKIKAIIDAAAEKDKRIVSRPRLNDMSDDEFIATFQLAEPVIERDRKQ